MSTPFSRLLPLPAIAFCLVQPAQAQARNDDWQTTARTLFGYYADAMVGKNYSIFLNACESKSRSLFREFTLWQMDMMSDEDLMRVLPSDETGRPIPLKDLAMMNDNRFWTVYTETMKKREMAVGEAAYKQLGQSGLPTYKLKVLTKYNDGIYMIVERTFAKPSPVPIPLTVLEAILEEGKWRLVLPREIMWDAMISGQHRQMELERAAAALPYDIKPPLRPTENTPATLPGAPDEKSAPAEKPTPTPPAAPPATPPAPAQAPVPASAPAK